MRRNKDILFVYSQPIIETANDPVGILQRRFILLVCPIMRILAGSRFSDSVRERNSLTNVSQHGNLEALISILQRWGIFRVIFKFVFYFILNLFALSVNFMPVTFRLPTAEIRMIHQLHRRLSFCIVIYFMNSFSVL